MVLLDSIHPFSLQWALETTYDTNEAWNYAGVNYTLDRTIPNSGVWQDKREFSVNCVNGTKTKNLFAAYGGDFSFYCIL